MATQKSILAGVVIFSRVKTNTSKRRKINKASINQLTSVSKEDRE